MASTVGEESMATFDEILSLKSKLGIAFERDDAGNEIVTDWQEDAYPEDSEA